MKNDSDFKCQKNHPENCLMENIEKIKDLLAEPISGLRKSTSTTSAQQTQGERQERQERQEREHRLNNQVRECRLNEQANEHEIDKCKQQSAISEQNRNALKTLLNSERQEAAAMRTEVQRLAAQNTVLQEHIDRLTSEHQDIRQVEKSGHQSTLRMYQQEAQKVKSQSRMKRQQVQAQNKLLAEQNLALEQTIQNHEGIMKRQKAELAKVTRELADNKQSLAELTEHVAELHEELRKLTKEKRDLRKELYKHEETTHQKQRLILNQQVANGQLAACAKLKADFEQYADQLAKQRVRAFFEKNGFPVEQLDDDDLEI